YRQEGTMEVRAAPAARRGVRLQYTPGPDTDEREPPRDHAPDVVAFFRYWNMTPPLKLVATRQGPVPAPGAAPLEVEPKSPKGQVKTQVKHQLTLRQGEQGLRVVVETRIHAWPLGEAVDSLDVQLPRVRPDALAPLTVPGAGGFPGAVPWGG